MPAHFWRGRWRVMVNGQLSTGTLDSSVKVLRPCIVNNTPRNTRARTTCPSINSAVQALRKWQLRMPSDGMRGRRTNAEKPADAKM